MLGLESKPSAPPHPLPFSRTPPERRPAPAGTSGCSPILSVEGVGLAVSWRRWLTELGPGVDASWGGEESQDLEAGVLAGRSFWGKRQD